MVLRRTATAKTAETATRIEPTQPQRQHSPETSVDIQQFSEGDFRLSRSHLRDRLLAERAGDEVQLVPADDTGDSWELTGLSSASLLIHIGFRNGDVLRHVDGKPIQTYEQLIDAFLATPSGSELEITVNRNGTPHEQRYELFD